MSSPLEIDCPGVQAQLEGGADFLLLDCRERDEYEIARIDGAVLVPMSELQARVGDLQPYRDKLVVVHCHHGGRSLRVAMWLRGQGYAHAVSMAGGIDRWSECIDPSIPRY